MRLSKARKECVTAMMRDTIAEAASSVLERHGTNGLTMDRVAVTAGLTAGSLYTYFESKKELMRFIHARMTEPFFEMMEKISRTDLSAPKRLEQIVRGAVERTEKHKVLYRLLAEAAQEHYEVKKQTRPRLCELLAALFECGIKEGSFRPHNPRHSACLCAGCLTELFELQASGASGDEVDGFTTELIDATITRLCTPREKGRGEPDRSSSSLQPST